MCQSTYYAYEWLNLKVSIGNRMLIENLDTESPRRIEDILLEQLNCSGIVI
jgi:hypothetical protein